MTRDLWKNIRLRISEVNICIWPWITQALLKGKLDRHHVVVLELLIFLPVLWLILISTRQDTFHLLSILLPSCLFFWNCIHIHTSLQNAQGGNMKFLMFRYFVKPVCTSCTYKDAKIDLLCSISIFAISVFISSSYLFSQFRYASSNKYSQSLLKSIFGLLKKKVYFCSLTVPVTVKSIFSFCHSLWRKEWW